MKKLDKITSRGIGIEKKIGQSFGVVATIYRCKQGENTYGTYTTFFGDIIAVNLKTGEEFESEIFYCPMKGVERRLVERLNDMHGVSVQLDGKFTTVKADNNMGYVWKFEYMGDSDEETRCILERLKNGAIRG